MIARDKAFMALIAFQFWTMRVIKGRPQFLMMALGTMFYMIGFGMFGIVTAYSLFVLAVVIITVGEMIVIPTSQAIAAAFYMLHARLGRQARFAPITRVGPSALAVEGERR